MIPKRQPQLSGTHCRIKILKGEPPTSAPSGNNARNVKENIVHSQDKVEFAHFTHSKELL
jgi:hypothetical protein